MMPRTRPDPDDLLVAIARETRKAAGGRLTIFFGACAGVGTTMAMLQAAHQRQAEAGGVSIGVVETHGRLDTGHLLSGLPMLPLRSVTYRDRTFQEFDLDGALAAAPALILLDELAHANCPGSRHARRWQDALDLLEAGIDVFTTLNVQHLESLKEIVAGITSVRVRDTVPDRIFDQAHEVQLIDLSPATLLGRLRSGRIYPLALVGQAEENFFREGNLVALRELALRRVADRVNADVQAYRTGHAVQAVWPTRERLMICVRADAAHEGLIREGARLAQGLHADLMVVHVDLLDGDRHRETREALRRLARLADDFGADFANIPGQDVASALLDYGRVCNATKFVVGHSSRRRRRPAGRLADSLVHGNPAIGIISLDLPRRSAPLPSAARPWIVKPAVRPAAIALLACAVTTAAAALLLQVFDLSNVVMLFLLTVVIVALRLGKWAGAWAAFLSVASFDFFFVEPRWSFAVSDSQYLFTFALMLVIALVTGQMAARLRADALVATAGERRATALARVARALSAAVTVDDIDQVCRGIVAPLFACDAALVAPDAAGRLADPGGAAFVDTPVAQWAFDHGQSAGLSTATLSGAEALYLPLKAPGETRGVLVFKPRDDLVLDPDQHRLLDACCFQVALALDRIQVVAMLQATQVRMQGEHLRNALLAAVSHDLKTPLTAISGLAQTLEGAGVLPDDERDETARAIRLQADGLRRLVANLLDVARLQSDGVRLNKEWHALDEIVGSALREMAVTLGSHSVKTRFPADLPLIELDASLFQRVLVNLLDNAVKYTPAGSTILVGAGVGAGTAVVYVEDDGPGLGTGDGDALFDPFTRGARESAIPGVGLGLALCRSIIVAHGGSIRALSREPRGARFEIVLPQGVPPDIEQEILA
jgi:two-component system sensor histidine kinase KdpD